MRKKKFMIFGIFLFFGIIGLSLLLNNNLGTFNIERFNQTMGSSQINILKWSKSRNAIEYKVIIKDSNKKIIKEETTTHNELIINDLRLTSNPSFTVDIIAYDKQKRSVKRSKTYDWSLPYIKVNKEEMPVLNKSDITDVTIDLLNNKQDNYVIISKDGEEIYRLENNKIDASILKNRDDYLGTYEIMLCQDDKNERLILHKAYLNIVPVPITNFVINKPFDNSEVPLADLEINFSGGEYANKYYYNLKEKDGNVIIDNALIDTYKFTISKDYLSEDTNYTLTIIGQHFLNSNITKSISINFKVAQANKVSKIMSTKSSGEIGKKRAVRLYTYTDATIYYTLDGSIPTKDSIKYNGSIFINHDLTIKAIAIKEGMVDSDILELNFKAVEKEPAIYLSPSTQDDNFGVSAVGYTTEREIMNKIGDYIEERLEQKKIIVYRNRPDMTLTEITNESSKYDVDLHLAIHSNAYNGRVSGVETWVSGYEDGDAFEIASFIQEVIMQNYYNPKGNRGVRYSSELGEMRETSPRSVTNGILVEIAFHDHYKDAKWMVDNQKKIGYAIADAVANYFGK